MVENRLKGNSEIGSIIGEVHSFATNLRRIASLMKDVGDAKFDNNYQLLGDNDVIGKAFVEMRNNLQKANEERLKMKQQEDLQNWSTTGFAKFGEILRQQFADNGELAYNIIKALVEYVNANQGGVFIVNDEKEREEKEEEKNKAVQFLHMW